MIKKDKLMEVLNFYKAFANSFARNLVLTYNLTNRVGFLAGIIEKNGISAQVQEGYGREEGKGVE